MPPLDEQEAQELDPNAKANKEAEEEAGSTYKPKPAPVVADDDEDDVIEGEDESSDEDDDTPEEVEYEGKTYQLPKNLKDAIMRNKDYTHKSQEVAKTRSELDAEKASIAEARRAHEESVKTEREFLGEVSEVRALDRRISEYKKVDWMAWAAQDHAAASAAQVVFNELMRQRRERVDSIEGKAKTEREKAKNAEREAQSAFERELPLKIKGWSPEKKAELREFVTKTYGYTAEDFDGIRDVKAMQLAADAHLGRQMRAKLKEASQKEVEPPPIPVKKIAAGAARVSSAPSDKDSDVEWERKERARMKAAGIQMY